MTACILQSQAAYLPITALASITVDETTLLLAGHGPFLRIYDLQRHHTYSTRAFDVPPVLGVRVAKEVGRETHHDLLVLVWGGSTLRLGSLKLVKQDVTKAPSHLLHFCWTAKRSCPDWILDVAFHDHGVLVLTAHNQLFELTVDGAGASHIQTVNGPKSFLYSGCLSIAQSGLVIIASGTVFGEVLVWTCNRKEDNPQWIPALRHVFHGHIGSVFGVSISRPLVGPGIQLLLASCSDDRTIQLWDISDCLQTSHGASRAITAGETGFGSVKDADTTHIASAWGHLSRIWDVDFVQVSQQDAGDQVCLLSRGEDGACQLWTVAPRTDVQAGPGMTGTLRPEASDRHHFGKNAWSMCKLMDDQGLVVYTGGADGQIIARRFNMLQSVSLTPAIVSIPFKDITASSVALKHYLLLNHRECLATTDQGHLYRLTMADAELKWCQLNLDSLNGGLSICYAEEQALTLIAQQRGGLFALLDGQDSPIPVYSRWNCGVSWIRVAGQHSDNAGYSMTAIVVVLNNKDVLMLWVNVTEGRTNHTSLDFPNAFTITACSYDQRSGVLLLGSRGGALAIYCNMTPESATTKQPHCLRYIHGTDSITSISVLQHDASNQYEEKKTIYALTTGRDGNYAIHRLALASCDQEIQPHVAIVHLSALPFGPNIEGAYFTIPDGLKSTNQRDLILYGFRSTSFVVWNESRQSEVISIECGGSHRSWSFKDNSITPGSGEMKSLVWTKAGKVNWHNSEGRSHTVIQSGGHGREIKAVARSTLLHVASTREQEDRVLLATGAEDTNIQLFAFAHTAVFPRSSERESTQLINSAAFDSIATLKRHTTGLQHLHFSPCGHYLFSSAGCEEFYVWKLHFDVPGLEIGVVLWDILPTQEENADSRIMSFDLCSTTESDSMQSQELTFVMAYSNGKSKIVRYTVTSARNEGTFATLQEFRYGSFCMMQACFLSTVPGRPAGHLENNTEVLSAGTNGQVNLTFLDRDSDLDHSYGAMNAESQLPVETHQVHQSSILAMDTLCLTSEMHLIATGGDDNALGLTMLMSSPATSGELRDEGAMLGYPCRHFRTILIPSAHAAAVTGLKIMPVSHETTCVSTILVTVSNDQRVNIWWVNIDLDKAAPAPSTNVYNDKLFEAMQIRLVGSAWTGVADVSGVEIIEDDVQHTGGKKDDSNNDGMGEVSVLVVGIGIEVLRVKWYSKEG